jgi:hypothetical protein
MQPFLVVNRGDSDTHIHGGQIFMPTQASRGPKWFEWVQARKRGSDLYADTGEPRFLSLSRR